MCNDLRLSLYDLNTKLTSSFCRIVCVRHGVVLREVLLIVELQIRIDLSLASIQNRLELGANVYEGHSCRLF